MIKGERRYSGKIAGIILFFMTMSMGFPFFFYYRFSRIESEILMDNRLKTGHFGMNVRSYLKGIPLHDESFIQKFNEIPLIGNIVLEIYDTEKNVLARRTGEYLEAQDGDAGLYRWVKRILDRMRGRDKKERSIRSVESVKAELVDAALKGRRSVDYIFVSGEVGDRILFYSYPLIAQRSETPLVNGVLLMEYNDPNEKAVIQNQRNQFARMCLMFGVLLFAYVSYILFVIILPLRRILIKSWAVIGRTRYLLPNVTEGKRTNEIGEMDRQLDRIAEMIDSRDVETEQYMNELKHIIRNPLSVIRVALEGLMMGKKDEKDHAFSKIIQKNLFRIDNYISSYSGIADIVKSKADVENIDITAFLKEIVQSYTPLAKRESIDLILASTGPNLIWKGFYSHLFYVLEQVINNAIDFSPVNGSIEIGAFRREGQIHIVVKDQGPGIPQGKENEIFKRYVSFRKKELNKHTGTGLSLSKNVLHKIGGNIYGKNSGSGGAVFTIILPLKP